MHAVSSTISRNVRDVDGPSNLSGAKGTPKSAQTDMNVSKFCWQTST